MKKLCLPAVMLGMTSLLTACPSSGGNTPPPAGTHALTVNVTGAAVAPVKVTNTTSGAALWNDTVTGTKTFSGITAGSVMKVEGSAVNGFTPAAQTVTMDADKTVVLAYTSASVTPVATAITGKVIGNTLKIGNAYLGSNRTPFFIRGSVDNSNLLSINLAAITPGDGDWFANFYGRCQGTNSNPQALAYPGFSAGAYSPQGEYIGEIIEVATAGAGVGNGQTYVFRIYSSTDWAFKGSCGYTDGSGKQGIEDVDVNLKKGWTLLMTTLSTSGLSQTTRNMAGDVRSELRFLRADPNVAARLKPDTLTFTSDASVTVDAEFLQIGGYSGQVTLSTDKPGLTVEPTTITLPALPAVTAQSASSRANLAAQLLQPQTVTTKLTFRYSGTENVTDAFNLIIKDQAGTQVGNGPGQLKVMRPALKLMTYGSPLQLVQGGTVDLSGYLFSEGGFTGSVMIRLEDLPPGVTATTQTVELLDSAPFKLTLSGGSSLTPGTVQATLVATGKGVGARVPLSITIPKPSVRVSVPDIYAPVVLQQGESGVVEVNLTSENGFLGKTTLTLSGLPSGVSASPVTASVAPGSTTGVRIPITAGTMAELGAATALLSSPDQRSPGEPLTLQLSIRPPRTRVGSLFSEPQLVQAGAGQGVWVVTEFTFDPAALSSTIRLRRYLNGQGVATVEIGGADGIYNLISLPSGEILVSLGASAGTLRVTAAGQTFKTSLPGVLNTGVADHLGRVWFIRNRGQEVNELARWTPSSNTVESVDATRSYEPTRFSLTSSNDRRSIVYLPYYSGARLLIDSATAKISNLPIGANTQTGGVAISASGSIWFVESYKLVRLNSDGTTTSFDSPSNMSKLVGFDEKRPEILWGLSYSDVIRVDVGTLKAREISVGNIGNGVILPDGGVAVTSAEFSDGQSVYLSVIR